MSRWHRKLVVDTIKTFIPFQNTLRRLKRKYLGYGSEPSNDSGLFKDAIHIITMMREAGATIEDACVLEFGSGWNPIVPLVFRICGAKQVILTDQEQLMDKGRIVAAINYIIAQRAELAAIGLKDSVVYTTMSSMLKEIELAPSLETALLRLGFEYRVPFDPKTIMTGACDIIVSRAVLEHVPQPVLQDFLVEFRRVLSPHGWMCHFIDLSDHWQHNDNSISRVNFLQYPDWLFRLTCLNPQNYQNRLRHSHFYALFEAAGFTVVKNFGDIHAPSLEALTTLPLSRRFAGLPHHDLATITAHMVMKPREQTTLFH